MCPASPEVQHPETWQYPLRPDTVAILELFTALFDEEGYRITPDGFSVGLLRRGWLDQDHSDHWADARVEFRPVGRGRSV